jgi:hypothetical protein
LILTAGALGGGAMASSGFAQSAASKATSTGGARVPARSPLEWLPKRLTRGGDANALAGAPTGGQHRLTSLINVQEGIKIAKFKKQAGWSVQIKPTGYRGIPIYTVKDLTVSLDGKAVDPNTMIFVYNNTAYKPSELKNLLGMQWWVFDWATLFVPGSISPGEHEVAVDYNYANTYNAGTATNGAKERLKISDEVAYLAL